MTRIEELEGVGPIVGAVFRNAGVKTVEDLLEVACDRKGRQWLSIRTGIDEEQLLRCANMADLFRIKGVAGQYAELLDGAGVDTVKELRQRNVENLVARMNEVNAEMNFVRNAPSVRVVASWIEQAKDLAPVITH